MLQVSFPYRLYAWLRRGHLGRVGIFNAPRQSEKILYIRNVPLLSLLSQSLGWCHRVNIKFGKYHPWLQASLLDALVGGFILDRVYLAVAGCLFHFRGPFALAAMLMILHYSTSFVGVFVILAAGALAILGTQNAWLEAFAVLLEAAAFLARTTLHMVLLLLHLGLLANFGSESCWGSLQSLRHGPLPDIFMG